jgi:hypothetical protein
MTIYCEYWHEGQPKPKTLPEGCEYQTREGTFSPEENNPEDWYVLPRSLAVRRWPVPEHIWRANRYCECYGISIPEGYEVIGFGSPSKASEAYLNTLGRVIDPRIAGWNYQQRYPILRKIEPEKKHVTPTDEDAKSRPTVEVSRDSDYWTTVTLVAVRKGNYPFLTLDDGSWEFCRMEVEP